MESYNIYFSGEIASGEALDDVRRRLGVLFNAREATLDKLFSGKPQLIKRNCSHEEAMKYQSAMQRAGAIATVAAVPAPIGTDAAAPARETAAPEKAARHAGSGAPTEPLSLSPAGTDVLLPDERHSVPARNIDLSAYSIAPAGDRLGQPAPAGPPPPDTSHLSALAIGDALPGLSTAPPPPAPDTAGLSLAEPTAELLDPRYRDHDTPPAPRTDHLSVASRDHD